jgi:isopenicillin N synthase-like dioxygenase
MSAVPIIDLTPWFTGAGPERSAVAGQVDSALQDVGFLLVTGHRVSPGLAANVRRGAREFFALPEQVKQRYAVTVGGRGWLPPGVEANGYAEGTATPPDLKESYSVGADRRTGDPAVDDFWFQPNVWPSEVPSFAADVIEYLRQMQSLADELLRLCAAALGVADDFFTSHTANSTHTMNINWYPPMSIAGEAQENQFRIGPHTDFGTVTILDREPGIGGLQVWNPQDGWENAPFHPDALTINIGDLLARWTGDRWRSNRHRVLPASALAPDEDLVSLVYFYEADVDAVVHSLEPPIGRVSGYRPVVSADFLRERLDAITIG